MQTCPKINFPRPWPTGPGIPPTFQGFPGRFRQFRRFRHRNLIRRIQTEKMRHVAMMNIHLFIIFQPFLQVPSFRTNLHRRQFFHSLLQFHDKSLIPSQNPGCTDSIAKQLIHQLNIHRRAHTSTHCRTATRHKKSIFRRRRRCRNQPAVFRFFYHGRKEKPGSPFQ